MRAHTRSRLDDNAWAYFSGGAADEITLRANRSAWNERLLQPGQNALFDDLLASTPTWDDVAWLQSITRLPVVLKDVLHPDDARQAASLGVGGVIVSNHGGRTLDTLPATASAQPRIVQALAGQVPVLVDGDVRRGSDILKAMALGASAVRLPNAGAGRTDTLQPHFAKIYRKNPSGAGLADAISYLFHSKIIRYFALHGG